MNSDVQFYKEENFKVVEADGFKLEIPEDWEVVRLGDVLVLLRNGLTYRQNKDGDGYPISRIETISDEKIDPSKVGYVNNIKPEELKEYRLEIGDILFSHINSLEHIGKTAIYEGVPEILLHGMNLILLRPNKSKIEPYYLLNLLRIYRIRGTFRNISKKAVNQASINQTQLKSLQIPLPPLPEQQKIAHVLISIDKAIEAVDEAIKQAERIKKGLMQELLTKGMGHKEFKDTEIGRIPKEWEVVKLEDVCVKITDGSHWSPKEVEKSEYRIATVANLRDRYIDINSCKPISKKDFEKLLREGDVPEKGDILFSKDGTVGICFPFNQDESKVALLSSIAIIKPKKQVLDSEFGAYILKAPKIFWQISGKKTGTALTRVVLKELKTIKIPLPSLSEQQKIAEILSKWDEVIELKRAKKERLERMKKKVMELLLAGKVRIK